MGTAAPRCARSGACLGLFQVVSGPMRGAIGGPGVNTEKWLSRSPDGPNRDSKGTFVGATPEFRWFVPLVSSCLGSLSTQLTLVLAYTLPNAHVGHLKMSEDFA